MLVEKDKNGRVVLRMRNSREQNQQCVERALWENESVKFLRDSVKARTGMDMKEAEFAPLQHNFSWGKARKKFMERSIKLREADSLSTFTQVLRAGIQAIVNQMYQSVETTFEDWVQVVNSDQREELYAPLHGVAFPREIGLQEKYAEVGAAALDIKLRNRKFGSIYPLELELLKFDRTGQFQQQAGLLGEYLKQVAEVYCYGKLASVSDMSYSELKVPVSETKPATEATYPWSASLQGGGSTILTGGAAVFNQVNIQVADIKLMNQLNLLGLKMSAKGGRIIVSPRYKFDAATLLNSSYFPTAQTTGTGTFQSINPIQGLYNLTVSRFMFDENGSVNANSKAWYLIDDTKPWFVLQMAEGAVTEQEATNAGDSFDRDMVRYKGRTMLNADHIDPRFAIQGSDGSV